MEDLSQSSPTAKRLYDPRLPDGYCAEKLADGTIRVIRKRSLDRTGSSIVLILVVCLVICLRSVLSQDRVAPISEAVITDPIVFCICIILLFILPCFALALQREEWYVGKHFLEMRWAIVGIKWHRRFTADHHHLWINLYLTDGQISYYHLYLCLGEQREVIVYHDGQHRKHITGLGAFLEEYTGWPLRYSPEFLERSYTEYTSHAGSE